MPMKVTKAERKRIKRYVESRGGERYRISDEPHYGSLHIYGKMPNSIETGWYLAAYVDELLARLDGEEAARGT
jgi:hypothetical protein